MNVPATPRTSAVVTAVYGLLDPIPFGCFVAALIFDVVYTRSADVLWVKGAAWLLAIGLVFAVLPRLINLTRVWIVDRRSAVTADKFAFWLNLLAVVAAIVNSFVHSRDAYAIVPTGMWLSVVTVVLLSISHVVSATRHSTSREFANA